MLTSPTIRRTSEKTTLHVVSTGSVANSLLESDVAGDILIWLDQLTTGPTPQSRSLEELTEIRTRYLEGTVQPSERAGRSWEATALQERDQMLRKCGEWEEVALWFGPTVVEQFSLMQILATLSDQNTGRTRISAVTCPRNLMGVYRPEELSSFFLSRTNINKHEIRFAETAWRLYCAPDPLPLFHFARENLSSSPVLCNALLWQLLQYPSVGWGLSILEYMLLAEVEQGNTIAHAIGMTAAKDDAVLLLEFDELYQMAWRFMYASVPLIEVQETHSATSSPQDFSELHVELADFGKKVFSGRADNLAVNGIDRWIGGVHLSGNQAPWRWDTEDRVLRQMT